MKCTVMTTAIHIVANRESVVNIAKAHGMTTRSIIQLNRIARPDLIRVGDKIKVQYCR